MKVFVAEDDPTSRALLLAMLLEWGYEAEGAEDGVRTWELLTDPEAPKLVLLDRSMPGLDGIDILRRLRSLHPEAPPYVILLTAKSENRDIVEGLDAGANDYVPKPFDPDILRARIDAGKRMLELQAGLIEARDALAFEATHDPLTGILNRRAILAALARERSRTKRESGCLTVGICDIDQFKSINDSLGHLVGDEVLRGFVGRLRDALREYDSLGRWGGDEFMVVAPVGHEEDARLLFERLRAAVAEAPLEVSAGAVSLTTSLGYALFRGQETENSLIAAADSAMYQAKAEGRNRVRAARLG